MIVLDTIETVPYSPENIVRKKKKNPFPPYTLFFSDAYCNLLVEFFNSYSFLVSL